MPNVHTSPEAFAALVREHQQGVFRTLTRLTGPGAHIEDLAQEAFLRLFRALPEFRGDAAIGTYLYRIVVNLAQDEWKRRRRERGLFASTPGRDDEDNSAWIENLAGDDLHEHARTPEQRFADAELSSVVDEELAQLPAAERVALVLYHQEELSYDAVAAALGLPINTVRTHLHRGRKRLSERIRARLGVPETEAAAGAAHRAAVPSPARPKSGGIVSL